MADLQLNTLYLLTPCSYVSRDHLTLQVEVPSFPPQLPERERTRDKAIDWRKLSIPIHHLESVCVFGHSTISAPALDLCWEHGVAVNFLNENGHLQARLTGVPDTSVTLRRAQFRAADNPALCAEIARDIVAGKIQNSRNSLLRAARETENETERGRLTEATDALARQLHGLARRTREDEAEAGRTPAPLLPSAFCPLPSFVAPAEPGGTPGSPAETGKMPVPLLPSASCPLPSFVAPAEAGGTPGPRDSASGAEPRDDSPSAIGHAHQIPLDVVRGAEGLASQVYFSVFTLLLKQQCDEFAFTTRSRRPPRDRINCLLSFIYALVRHDCVAALTSAGLDPFVGFLHADRPNRPSLALDLMEEFRPWLADRLAVTLINRQQIGPGQFKLREGGAVEFTDPGRKLVIQAYQERKKETLTHPLLEQNLRIGQLAFIQARMLARRLRGDLSHYVPLVPK